MTLNAEALDDYATVRRPRSFPRRPPPVYPQLTMPDDDIDVNDRVDYVRRLIAARFPELTPATSTPSRIFQRSGRKVVDVLAAMDERLGEPENAQIGAGNVTVSRRLPRAFKMAAISSKTLATPSADRFMVRISAC